MNKRIRHRHFVTERVSPFVFPAALCFQTNKSRRVTPWRDSRGPPLGPFFSVVVSLIQDRVSFSGTRTGKGRGSHLPRLLLFSLRDSRACHAGGSLGGLCAYQHIPTSRLFRLELRNNHDISKSSKSQFVQPGRAAGGRGAGRRQQSFIASFVSFARLSVARTTRADERGSARAAIPNIRSGFV